jgi:hypothetical protein
MKLVAVFILSVINLFAIITIAPVNIGDKPGYSGTLKGSFETKRGNSDVDNYSAGLRAQYDNNSSYVLWSDFVFAYGKAFGETNTNKTYAHVRLVHTFLDIKELNYEGFIQLGTNEFTNVEERNLIGGGLRYHKDLKNYGNFYLGLGGFYEEINYLTSLDPREKNIRVNSYISYTKAFDKKSKISYVMYYQPKVDESADFIVSNALELQVLIYKTLFLNFVLYYDVDSKPAHDIKKRDFTQKTSFLYKF